MKKYGVLIGLAIISAGVAGWYWYYDVKKQGAVTAEKQVTGPKITSTTVTTSEISLSPLSICRVLDKAVEFLNISPEQIIPVSAEQQAFLSADYATYRQHMKKDLFAPHELKAYVARDAETFNKILRDNGFTIQLKEFTHPDSIGVVAIQDILVKWLEKAERKSIRSGKKEYAGFHLDEKKMDVSFSGNNQDNPTIVIAEIATQSKDKVYCAIKVKISDEKTAAVPFFADKDSPSDHDVIHTIDVLREQFKNPGQYPSVYLFNAIELPMINYQEQPSVKWFKGLKFPGYAVDQALQEVIFKMNEVGARAKAAFAIGMCGSAPCVRPKEPLIVNQPFLLWIERPGMPLPIFAAYLEQKYWSDPGSIEDIVP
jgi:hypothetical protein